MKIVIVVQARMGSGRLPGKVLRPLVGKPMLVHLLERLQTCRSNCELAVATSREPQDGPIVDWARSLGVYVHQGSENDVVERYYETVSALGADAVARVTADCPFIDPQVVDQVVEAFREAQPDYAANVLERTWPRGLDVDIYSARVIEAIHRDAAAGAEREHLDLHVLGNPARFSALSVRGSRDYSTKRWTVDTPEDMELVRRVYAELYARLGVFGWRDVLTLLRTNPEWETINRDVVQRHDDPTPDPKAWRHWRSLTVES